MPRALLLLGLISCTPAGLDPAGLADPAACEGCHPDQVREWAASRHAYASDDPVFTALIRLGERETGAPLGEFCRGCHQPLDDQRGVTCVACHQVAEVVALHNGGLRWSRDDTMRGALGDPVDTPAHRSAYSPLVDGNALASSDTCGACHDVVTPAGLAVERTYAEWSESVFARPEVGVSCAGCHMPGRDAPAAYGERVRRVHDHGFPGVDLALPPWPGIDEQRVGIARDLAAVLSASLCPSPTGGGVTFEVTLDNVQGGHAFPSGVTHARRAWVELIAEEDGVVTAAIGRFAPDDVVALDDPDAWVLGSRFLGADGAEVPHVWDAVDIDSELLPPAVTLDPTDPAYYHAVTRPFFIAGEPDVVTVVVRMQPIALDLIDRLIAAGELDPAVRDAMPVFDLEGTAHEWRRDRDGWACAP